jgi:acetyl esterase/lipase
VRDIAYAATTDSSRRLDLYQRPGAAPAPVLLYFHGGSWTTGARPKAASSFRSFLALGFSVLSVDYRLSGVAPAPAAVQDARCALAWVKANAGRYNLDTARIVTYGTSAGGQLALMAAMLPRSNDIDAPRCGAVPRVAAVLDYYGPADVGAFALKSRNTLAWLGGPERRDSVGRAMSPLAYVRAGLPPVLLIHGDADPTVPHEQSVRLRDALVAAGVPARLYTVPGGLHGNFSAEQKQAIDREVAAFLAEHRLVGPGLQQH